ncbi:hypothetical protein [Thermaerobacter composti]|uniref:Uncharacterized protein n=1 Tax=Thermaerobacter composti TaxID=554949 RepID=A0ABZ0QTM0_9FIRM|nr:hypothetical protein [Thermaerobacter composti]WPD20192.1 hypothetical protein Q5761_06060 [Thermaerobacter composti]
MPAGYSSRCKICNHPRRAAIEQWHLDGASFREIQRRLEGTVSFAAVRNHFVEHFNVREEAFLQWEASQQQLEQAGAKRVSDIQLIDQVIERSAKLNAAAASRIQEYMERNEKPPKALVDLYGVTAAELRQHAKAKQELLGETPADDLAEVLMRLVGEDDPADP